MWRQKRSVCGKKFTPFFPQKTQNLPKIKITYDRLYSSKIKKCELEAEREVNPHTQSPHSHSIVWAHLGLNQGPPDYESGALTN